MTTVRASRSPTPAEASLPDTFAQSRPVPWHAPPQLTKSLTVLVVDDDPILLELTAQFLGDHGFNAVRSANGPAALRTGRLLPQVDLLLTDLEMPGMGGLELALALTTARPELPVIVVSGAILKKATSERIERYGWHFVQKPWQGWALLHQIGSALKRNLPGPTAP